MARLCVVGLASRLPLGAMGAKTAVSKASSRPQIRQSEKSMLPPPSRIPVLAGHAPVKVAKNSLQQRKAARECRSRPWKSSVTAKPVPRSGLPRPVVSKETTVAKKSLSCNVAVKKPVAAKTALRRPVVSGTTPAKKIATATSFAFSKNASRCPPKAPVASVVVRQSAPAIRSGDLVPEASKETSQEKKAVAEKRVRFKDAPTKAPDEGAPSPAPVARIDVQRLLEKFSELEPRQRVLNCGNGIHLPAGTDDRWEKRGVRVGVIALEAYDSFIAVKKAQLPRAKK